MQDSDKDKNTFDDNLDNLDSENLDFDADLDFENDWEDDADLDELLAEAGEPSAESSKDLSTEELIEPLEKNLEQKFGSKQKSEPDNFPKAKKKRPTLIITILVIFLAVGLTAYNTLRPSLSPTLLPVIKLHGSSVEKNDDNFMNDAQKRIDEIIEKKNTERSAKDDLMEPFEAKDNVQDASKNDNSSVEDVSVLTPLPTNFDNSTDDLPSLEEALEQVLLGAEEGVNIELSDGSELIDDGSAVDPFSENALLDTINEDPPTLNDVETIDSPETLELQSIDSPPFPSDDQNNAETLAFEQEEALALKEGEARKAAQEAQERKKAEETAAKTKIEAEKKAKEEAASKAKQAAASAKEKASSAKTKKVVKTSSTPIWEIRGIRPGRAVLYDKVSGDIEAVEPGSKIRGLGRIKEISKKHGRWVVLGDKGNVTQ